MIPYGLYICLAFVVAATLSTRTDKKWLSFILTFWIFTQPIFGSVFLLRTPELGFDFQPNRVLFVLLLPYLFFFEGGRAMRKKIVRPPFEKYIYAYLILVTLALAANFDFIRKQSLGAVPLDILIFLVTYVVMKRHATQPVLDAVIRAVIITAVTSAVISLIQLAIDENFLKTAIPRLAFGSVIRASGIFQSEYELGYMQILAIFIAFVKYRGVLWRWPLILLFAASLFSTFHRLDILILMTCTVSYIWFFGTTGHKAVGYGAIALVILLSAASFFAFEAQIGKGAFVQQRLTEDTVSGRIQQYKVVIDALPAFAAFGLGDYTNKKYYELMETADMVRTVEGAGTANWRREAYAVHDGYLEVAVLYGVPAMVAFVAMLFSMLAYFKKRLNSKAVYSVAPFYAVFILILANISNGVSAFRLYFVVLLAILAGCMVAMQRRAVPEKHKHLKPQQLLAASPNR